jgi:hypothetical protein
MLTRVSTIQDVKHRFSNRRQWRDFMARINQALIAPLESPAAPLRRVKIAPEANPPLPSV